jgi:predicted phosphodiesterase
MNKFSILHISDLHKDNEDNYDNLFSSLKDDCDNYIKSGIIKPQIIVVSGDIIRGGDSDEIIKQYNEVKIFLNGLTNYFLDGDKSRIIIVPGNHDIDWNVSKAVMEKDLTENNVVNTKSYLTGRTETRWSWDELCFYKITNKILYETRLKSFIDFYNSYYAGDRIYSDNPNKQFQIFDIPALDIAFIALNSCYNTDHLNKAGCVKPECITAANQDIRNLNKMGRLLIGVWHHNIDGLPNENNYLDKRMLKILIEKQIQVGLFGHIHQCDMINEYKDFFEDKKIVLISAGTLYGNRDSLTEGTKRQYNILEICRDKNDIDLTLYSREDKSRGLYSIPSWGEGRIGDGSSSKWTIHLISPQKATLDSRIDYVMQETEKRNDFKWGIDNLLKLDFENITVRKILLDYMERINDYESIYYYFNNSTNNIEAISAMNAAEQLNDFEKITTIINTSFILNNADAAVMEMHDRLKLILKRKGYGTN